MSTDATKFDPRFLHTRDGIRHGEGIAGTSLIRRYRGEQEVEPVLCPRAWHPVAALLQQASKDAKAAGFAAFRYAGQTYKVA